MLNKAQVIGYVGKEPKISTTQNNAKIASFSIAATEKSYTTQNGVTIPERTEWHNIVVFGKLADVIEKYVHKGSRMYVEGKMRTRAFTDKNGVQKTIWRCLIVNRHSSQHQQMQMFRKQIFVKHLNRTNNP